MQHPRVCNTASELVNKRNVSPIVTASAAIQIDMVID
jgi:hypothetical protein